jgi:hypothetical protein
MSYFSGALRGWNDTLPAIEEMRKKRAARKEGLFAQGGINRGGNIPILILLVCDSAMPDKFVRCDTLGQLLGAM